MNAYKANNNVNERAQELLEKIYLAAKKSKTRRFHILYDKVHRMDILSDAWKIVKANKGTVGVDRISIEDIIEFGEERFLLELHELLLDTHRYHPRKIRRVYIPKADGKQRPLGIPAVRDRIVQTATKLMIEPIFEADFLEFSYGFRPNRSAHDALEEIRRWANKGYTFVLDADIKGYFDNINHEKLLELVHQRINDRKILKLIMKWLKCGVVGELERNEIGTPQGGVISPLLANIYLHELDKFWSWQTIERGKLIRYADDFVILCRNMKDAEIALKLVKTKLTELGLTLNEEKTKIVDTTDGRDGFGFLGFYNRQVYSTKHKRRFMHKYPKREAVKKVKQKTGWITNKRASLYLSESEIVNRINPILRGWMNYFRFGNSTRAFKELDSYVHERMVHWWSKKRQKSGRRWTDLTWEEFKQIGIQITTGNVIYWSRHSKAQ